MDAPEDGRLGPDDAGTCTVRITLDDTSPPLARRIEVASTLTLDALHEVIQVVFGWTDSHLHRFASTPEHDDTTHYYLSAFDLAEGDDGTPEEQVRADQPYAICLDGERPGPPEDCGGAHGYELIAGASDPDHPDHARLADEFADGYGDEVDPAAFDLVPFDLDAVNAELDGLALAPTATTAPVPAPVAELLAGVHEPRLRRQLWRLAADADLGPTVPPDVDSAAGMTGRYRWLLERVGDDGITLTAAGYLPPVHVRAAVDELGLDETWIGAGNRENQTVPVLALRESAQELGLLRKHRGRLLTTARGRAVADDPVTLWQHLAERMPLGARDEAIRQAGLVLLLAVAAGSTDGLAPLVADVLTARGWRLDGRRALDASTARRILWGNVAMLRGIGALTDTPQSRWPGQATPEGVAFARTAVTS